MLFDSFDKPHAKVFFATDFTDFRGFIQKIRANS